MRLRHSVPLSIALLMALASLGATAFAASDNAKGNSAAAHQNRGQSQKASSSSHDPSNPDGTYQGKSSSTPDQDGIGADHGIVNNDKVGPETDGNNGCGNDPDREDDNNGWCGRQAAVSPTPSPTVAPTQTTGGENGSEVLGETFTRPTPKAEVLGISFARTGTAVLTLSLLAVVLVAMGIGIRAIAKPSNSI